MLDQCVTFKKIFNEKDKAAEFLFQGGALSINKLPSLKHHEKGKSQVMMTSHVQMEVEGDEAQ